MISIAASVTGYATSAYGLSLTNTLTIPGESTDLYSFEGNGALLSIVWDFSRICTTIAVQNVYYGLSDRSPGGGVIEYNPRVQKFSLDVDSKTGAIANFKVFFSSRMVKTSTA